MTRSSISTVRLVSKLVAKMQSAVTRTLKASRRYGGKRPQKLTLNHTAPCPEVSHSASSMATTTKLAQKMNNIAAAWPKDPFRPQIQLKTFLTSLSAHPNLTPQAVQAARALKDNDMFKKV